MSKCATRNHSQYSYHAHAYGFAGQLERPFRHTIPTQASAVLGTHGGQGHHRVENFRHEGIISFDAAYVEVGGSYDECHNQHTSFSSAIIEKLNILDMVTADRVVSRIAVYSGDMDDKSSENTYNITGSHFENLKIAGHKIDVKLATHIFQENNSHSKLAEKHKAGELDEWLLASKLGKLKEPDLQELEEEYHALEGMSEVINQWKKPGSKRATDRIPFSPLNHMDIKDHAGRDTELRGFGSIICIPKFGVVRLAELTFHHHHCTLTMLRVDMCSTGTGTGTTTTTSGGGSKPGGGG
ncbi:MAG TPA: hypothetical protein VFR08_13255 [Candidatus Angelobacter sp.]|nr:hypothetical protein [Candidatus Angelobacter sp.]